MFKNIAVAIITPTHTKRSFDTGLSEKTKRYAVKILKKAKQNEISAGKDPMGLAASALYISNTRMGMKCSQKIIAQAAGITEVTVRNRCQGLKLLDI